MCSFVSTMKDTNNIAVFAGGCFWCTEAVFQNLKGVISVTPCYTGGKRPNPTYDQICSGATGHAEAVKIVYDPHLISFKKLLVVFFATHDPTTLNRQGHDIGTQYRSAIFYASEIQKKEAKEIIDKLTEKKIFSKPIVTTLEPLSKVYPAEQVHHNYYNRNKDQGYCRFVIDPKLQKLKTLNIDDLERELFN